MPRRACIRLLRVLTLYIGPPLHRGELAIVVLIWKHILADMQMCMLLLKTPRCLATHIPIRLRWQWQDRIRCYSLLALISQ